MDACRLCGRPPTPRNDEAAWWARFHAARAARLARVERIEELPFSADEPRARWPRQNVREAARSLFFAALCLALTGVMFSSTGEVGSLGATFVLAMIGAAGAVLCLRRIVQVVWAMHADATAPTFRRYTGALRVEDYGDGAPYWCLWVRDDRLHVPEAVASLLGKLPWGSVDYTQHARVVLRVRDEGGNLVWPPPAAAQADQAPAGRAQPLLPPATMPLTK
ncbi:MAG TPA: hypothetical protein VGL23_08450 [Chloroflexota bacterium]